MSAELTEELTDKIRSRCNKAQVHLDRFDMDFIIGAMMDELGKMNAVLTDSGVRRRKQ